jgi:hypothetical protein
MEGEGSIMIRKTSGKIRPQLAVSVANTDIELLAFFPKYWGGCITTKTVIRNKRHKQPYRWCAVSQQAARFIRDIRPYLLATRNRNRASIGLALQAHKQAWRSAPWMDGAAYTATQMAYYDEMSALNAKGPRLEATS